MRGFGDLEAVIMHRVSERSVPATVREIFDETRARGLLLLHGRRVGPASAGLPVRP